MLDAKTLLHRYLQTAREALLWKLEGLSEYDVRRTMTPTGTNLLGVVKHVASVESGYFGFVFNRPSGESLPWFEDDAEPNADMWAAADESREQIVGLYRRVWAHSDATILALDLDAIGLVPHWPPDRCDVTLQQIRVHMVAETRRHAGHADIVRELIDETVGLRADNDNMAPGDRQWWQEYRRRLERVAREAEPDRVSPPRIETSTSACPLCREVDGIDTPIAHRDDIVTVFPARHVPVGHEGAVLVATTAHIPTLYDADDALAAALLGRVRDTAVAVQRTFDATGTTIRQNNGVPGQEIAHLHFHIAPRFAGDNYWHGPERQLPHDERAALADRLRADFAANAPSTAATARDSGG